MRIATWETTVVNAMRHGLEISRADSAPRADHGAGWNRNAAMQLVAITALAVSSFAVVAEPMRVGGEPTARAYVDFRIVIPETLHIDSRAERRSRSQTFVSRTTQAEDGRTVVTVARP